MAPGVTTDVLEERFRGLEVWLEERFERLGDRMGGVCNRVERLEREVRNDHEQRLERLERAQLKLTVAWGVVSALALPMGVRLVMEFVDWLFGRPLVP